ncbi:WD40 repeat-like protein [Linnemannia elongata AG-77]|uniref:WD40 repeat-like protein n=1 Tax=Linnemannia elongata AG-77 TaxID=1314771 RepID=A0A197K0T2_9FUNG|nr:WD40 repeat-like protein [Linnemannia elongata AG-77]
MDIVSRLPVEIAHQVLSNLDIQDVAACQQVSRQWYWIAIDPLVWKNVFLERERTFAIPTGSYPFPTKGKGVVQQPSAALSTLTTPVTTSGSSSSSSSSSFSSSARSSSPPFSSISSVSFSGLKSRLTGAITTATSTTATAATTPPPAAQSAATVNETANTTNTKPNIDDTMVMSTMRDRDWKKECRTRIMSDRNWARGHIQAVFTLKVHKGAIVRLRIKSDKLLSADMFGQVAVWDTTTYKCEGVIEAAVGPIQLLDFSTAAMVMTVISKSGICRIWDIQSKRLIHSSTATYVTCMTMNDEYLIMGSKGGEIQVIDFMTGQVVASTASFPGETLQDIYIQNNTLIIATDHHIRIVSIDTLELLLTSPLPIPPTTHAYCCVFHIRSLILLTDEHLLHIEWEPLYSHKDDRLLTDTRFELPPNLTKAPLIHRTKISPILTITSIAIGGKHPHVLTTNADRPSLNDAIRVCPVIPRHHFYGKPSDEFVEASRSRSRRSQLIRRDDVPRLPLEDDDEEEEEEVEDDELNSGLDGSEAEGIVLTSQVDAISDYLETCGLKPSFMDVDEDVIVVGTSKGDIVVLHMMPQD